MDFVQAQQRSSVLQQLLQQHNYQYYVLDAPSIPDADYDALTSHRLSPCLCYSKSGRNRLISTSLNLERWKWDFRLNGTVQSKMVLHDEPT